MKMSAINQLALDIARCTEVSKSLLQAEHPCSVIVRTQTPMAGNFRQVPEAWAGNLEMARILYISSNPSISTPELPRTGEDYPLAGYDDLQVAHVDWPDDNRRLIDFQTQRLDQNRDKPLVTKNAQFLCQDDEYRGSDKAKSTGTSQKYWKIAINQAKNLIGEDFDLSTDMCMTEIVHCKSKQEKGVSQASELCSQKYFHRILELSSARLLIIGGRFARDLVIQNFKSWNIKDGHTWEIENGFGSLRGVLHDPRPHVGLFTSETKQCIVIACQQLSYASNKYRYVEQVLGQRGFENLKAMLRAPEPLQFDSRIELLESLGLE